MAGRQVYRQTSCNKSTGRKKDRERKKEGRNGGYREMAPSVFDMNNVEIQSLNVAGH